MHKKKTILHLIDTLGYGGAQALLVLLARTTPKEYSIIICVLQPDDEMKKLINNTDVKIFCFNRKRPSITRPHQLINYIYKSVRDIIRICEKEKVDIIQTHLSDAEFLGGLAGFLCGIERFIPMIHYPDILPKRYRYDPRTLLRIIATRLIYKYAYAVIAVSNDVARNLKDLFYLNPQKVKIILNKIDVASIKNTYPSYQLKKSILPHDNCIILTTVARLMPPKGHNHLLDAVSIVTKKTKNIYLLLAGDGDLRMELELQCKKLFIEQNVIFLGKRDDIPEILSLTQIFILPSLWEGTSLALLEAMAAGKAIISTDIPGNRCVLEHNKNALLVPPAKSKELAEAIAFLIENPSFSKTLGENAYKTVYEKFDIRILIQELKTLWD